MGTDPNFDISGNGGYARGTTLYLSGSESSTTDPYNPDPVNLIVDGQTLTGTVAAGSNGIWRGYAPISPGIHTVAATETIGSQTYVTRTVTYDVITPPVIAFSPNEVATNKAQQTLSGTVVSAGGPNAVAGQLVTITDNGQMLGQTRVGSDGTWSTQATLPSIGQNSLNATVSDTAGNTSFADATYLYETTAHAVAISDSGGLTNQTVQRVRGTATTGDAITLVDNGVVVGSTTTNANGTWWINATLPSQGSNMLQAVDTSPAGNVGTSGTVNYTLDTLPPTVSITSAATSVRAASDTETVTGTAEVGSSVMVSDDGAPPIRASVGADGSWSAQVPLHPGPNGLTAQATDAAGNVGLSNTITDTLDTTPVAGTTPASPAPSVTAISNVPAPSPPAIAFGAPPQLNGTVATLTGTASDAAGVTGVEIFQGTAALGAAQVNPDGTWTFTHDFGQGLYDHLTAMATDPAGLTASASAAYDLVTGIPGRHTSGEVKTLAADGSVASATTIAADGSVGAQTVANGDGTATSTGYANGQALFSIGNDVMTGNGYRETFVFQPTMGHARITDFVVAGAGHDTLTLSHQDFANVAQVLNSTTMNHGSAVIHVSPDDTIRLAGVTRADLAQHRGDFAFTS